MQFQMLELEEQVDAVSNYLRAVLGYCLRSSKYFTFQVGCAKTPRVEYFLLVSGLCLDEPIHDSCCISKGSQKQIKLIHARCSFGLHISY